MHPIINRLEMFNHLILLLLQLPFQPLSYILPPIVICLSEFVKDMVFGLVWTHNHAALAHQFITCLTKVGQFYLVVYAFLLIHL
jgi:hypothetical protein